MTRCRNFGRVFLALFISIFPLGANAAPNSNPTRYSGQVDFGAQLLHFNDGCASVHGALTAGNFFDDLKRSDHGGQLVFRKSSQIVSEYPESVTTAIRISGDPCVASLPGSPSAIFRGNAYSLKLEVYWKHEMQLRPAMLSPVEAYCVGYSSTTGRGESVRIPSISCQITVDSKGVPLEDHLIVWIIGPDGKLLTRISAAP
ncbi:MAG TPA: hypothetical protein VEJ38_04830 [Candidatus Acidoferrales bacterium]|nr:hypothetical protein [Candidatus Acidoferrales bacterium]